MTTEITLHTVNEEPRVLDTDLAERLAAGVIDYTQHTDRDRRSITTTI